MDKDWESIKKNLQGTIKNIDAGPLYNPIKNLEIKRDKDLKLTINTKCETNAKTNYTEEIPGTITSNKNSVEINFTCGKKIIAHDVQPRSFEFNSQDCEVTERASIGCLEGYFSPSKPIKPKFIIEWISNISDKYSPTWPDSCQIEIKNSIKRTIGNMIDIPIQTSGVKYCNACIQIKLDKIILYIGVYKPQEIEKPLHIQKYFPGFIIYEEPIEAEEREKIRHSISFALGSYIVYLGESHFSKEWSDIYFKAETPNTINGTIFNPPNCPLAPLSFSSHIDNGIISNTVNKIYKKYNDYDLRHISWLYWHSLVSVPHIQASQLGATIEALRDVFIKNNKTSFKSKILEKNIFNTLKTKLENQINELNDSDAKKTLLNKINNLNNIPNKDKNQQFFNKIGLNLTKKENDVWKHRNKAAHGSSYLGEEFTKLCTDIKVLRTICNRIILKICDAGEYYVDYRNENKQQNYPFKKIEDPVLGDKHSI